MWTTIAVLTIATTALAAPSTRAPNKRDTAPIYDGSQVGGKTYDYVIAGGGLGGMVLASRLSEDSGKTILVIEAGYNEEDRQDVYDTSRYQSTFDTFLDWAYKTVPQSSANDQPTTVRAGRALGGSTIINGMAWSKPHSFQIDALEQVGNTGVNWNSLQTYMKRAENFQAPSSAQFAAGVTYNPSCHAANGPIGIQYDPNSSPQQLERDFNVTVLGQGLPYAYDLTCGNPAGASPIANTRSGNIRIDAYRGYLYQKSRPNLTILSGANVGKVVLSTDSTPRATGLEFRDEKGQTYTANARREVLMATGSIKTPVILQQSGIGPQSVLQNAGVTQRIDLPVGLNLIDQTTVTTNWGFKNARGGGQPITFPRFQDLFKGSEADQMRSMLQNDLGSYVQDAVNSGSISSSAGLQKVLEIQRSWILQQNAGVSENFDYSYGSTLGYDSWYLLPFGRGSVKITNNQPYSSSFNIDPRFFSNRFDALAQAATVRFTRTVSQASPLNQDVTGETTPAGAVPDNANLDSWLNWVKNNYRSNWHPIGTAAMMSKDLGGVVDSRNRVYGVNGLRVVDGSILPFQVSSHLMSVLYGLAERAADLIKQDNSGNPPTSSSSSSASRSSSSSASRSSSASSSSSSAPPTVTGRALHPNNDNAKCVQVRGTPANGSPVEMADCNNSNAQKWTIARGSTTVKLAGTNYCLDAGNTPSNGVAAKVWTCYAGLAAQTWYYTDDNRIAVQGKGQCLDLTNGSKNNGNVLQTWECSTGNNNQVWTL